MPLFVFGVNHKTAPVTIREKVAFSPENLKDALMEFGRQAGVNEALILSTCNRTEVYCHVERDDWTPYAPILFQHYGLHDAELRPFVFSFPDDAAVRHLLRVASGLDSMVLGEPQILGQLKAAYSTAMEAGTIGKLLGKLVQHSFSVAKKVRTDTAVGNSPVSVAFAAVRLAQQIFGELTQQTALLIGAGDTIELAAHHLHENRLGRVIIANRSLKKAQALASAFGGYAISLSDLPAHLAEADIVFSSTGSRTPILGREAVKHALQIRKHQPIFIVDIAVPRDVEPEVASLADVYLYTVDDLDAVIEENLRSRRMAAQQADEIIATQSKRFMDWLQSLDAVWTIRAVRQKAEQLRDEALYKARRQLARGDDPAQVLDSLATALTNKLTHVPSTKLREAGAEGRDEILRAARDLFDLDTEIKR